MSPRVNRWFQVTFKGNTKDSIEENELNSDETNMQAYGQSIAYTVKRPEKSTSVPSGIGFILIMAKQRAAWNNVETETPSLFVFAMIAAVSCSEAVMV